MALASARLLIGTFAARYFILGDVAKVIEEVGKGLVPAVAHQPEEDVIATAAASGQQLVEVATLPARLVTLDPDARTCIAINIATFVIIFA